MVVLFHFRLGSPITNNSFVLHGYLMVDLFFVLSGFVTCLSYRSRLNSISDLMTFQRKRFFRLYPLYFFSLMIGIAIFCIEAGISRYTGY